MNWGEFTSSGSFKHPDGFVTSDVRDAAYNNNELIWVGYHDCREALRFHIRRLREDGTFLNPWKSAGGGMVDSLG